jgi:uncharacterized membrane protein
MAEENSSAQKLEVKISILATSLALHILFVSVYILNYTVIDISVVRQAVGLLYSLFVPGMLLMLVFNIDEKTA